MTTTTLRNLLVLHEVNDSGAAPLLDARPATVADLVAALIAEGGEIRTADITPAGCVEDYWNLDIDDLEKQRARWGKDGEYEPGRYLVFPIPVESAEAKETPR